MNEFLYYLESMQIQWPFATAVRLATAGITNASLLRSSQPHHIRGLFRTYVPEEVATLTCLIRAISSGPATAHE